MRKCLGLGLYQWNLKNKLDELLKELYSLGEDDIKIPLIKDLYETN